MSKEMTLLYVEDDAQARVEIADIFLEFFDHIIVGTDGKNGLELFKHNAEQIDLIITDITMPYINGIEMIEKIHATTLKNRSLSSPLTMK